MGFSCITTVLSAAKSQDLTDLATAKDELRILPANTADDSWLRRAISNVSASVATYCQRVFLPELIEDVLDFQQDPYPYQTPGRVSSLQLSRWPVVALISVEQITSPGNRETLTDGTDFRLNAELGELVKLNRYTSATSTWDTMPIVVRYVAGFGVAGREEHTVPASAPFTVTPTDAGFSCDIGVTLADGTALTRVSGTPGAGQYRVSASGVYYFHAAQAGAALTFDFASRAVPSDLVDVALRVITARYHARGRDPMLVSIDTDDIGTKRWWVGGTPGQSGPFTPEIAGMLDQYNMPVVA